MSPEVFQQVRDIFIESCSDAELQILIDALKKRRHANMVRDRSRLVNRYRIRWYPDLGYWPAARAIERDLARMEASGFKHRASPPIADSKLADAFDLWRAGPILKAESLRKLFPPLGHGRGGKYPTTR